MPLRITFRYLVAKSLATGSSVGASIILLLLAALLSACAVKPFQAHDPAGANFIGRAITQEIEGMRVTAAVPDAAETAASSSPSSPWGSGLTLRKQRP